MSEFKVELEKMNIRELLSLYRERVSESNGDTDEIKILENEISSRTVEEDSQIIAIGQKWICTDDDSLEFGLIGEIEKFDFGMVYVKLPETTYLSWTEFKGGIPEFKSKYTRIFEDSEKTKRFLG